jgi:hypothetical protein
MLQLKAHLNMHAGSWPRILRLCRYAAIRSSKEPRLTSFISRNGEKNLNKTCNTSVLAIDYRIDVRDPHMFLQTVPENLTIKPDRARSFASLAGLMAMPLDACPVFDHLERVDHLELAVPGQNTGGAVRAALPLY